MATICQNRKVEARREKSSTLTLWSSLLVCRKTGTRSRPSRSMTMVRRWRVKVQGSNTCRYSDSTLIWLFISCSRIQPGMEWNFPVCGSVSGTGAGAVQSNGPWLGAKPGRLYWTVYTAVWEYWARWGFLIMILKYWNIDTEFTLSIELGGISNYLKLEYWLHMEREYTCTHTLYM